MHAFSEKCTHDACPQTDDRSKDCSHGNGEQPDGCGLRDALMCAEHKRGHGENAPSCAFQRENDADNETRCAVDDHGRCAGRNRNARARSVA